MSFLDSKLFGFSLRQWGKSLRPNWQWWVVTLGIGYLSYTTGTHKPAWINVLAAEGIWLSFNVVLVILALILIKTGLWKRKPPEPPSQY